MQFYLVDETPSPVFAGLQRTHDGMLGAMKMLGGVLVLRGVAASHVPALHAQPQMDPGVAHLQALFGALGVRRYFVNMALMLASVHRALLKRNPAHTLAVAVPGFLSGFGCFRLPVGSGVALSLGALLFVRPFFI